MKRGYISGIVLLYFSFHVVFSVQPESKEFLHVAELNEDSSPDVETVTDGLILSGSLFGTVKRYSCKVDVNDDEDLLLFGTKSWAFPTQDVTLKIDYPSSVLRLNGIPNTEYILTKFEIILYLDGSTTKGYINDGGLLQNHISMTFILENISVLSYSFSLYGVQRRDSGNNSEIFVTWNNLCNTIN